MCVSLLCGVLYDADTAPPPDILTLDHGGGGGSGDEVHDGGGISADVDVLTLEDNVCDDDDDDKRGGYYDDVLKLSDDSSSDSHVDLSSDSSDVDSDRDYVDKSGGDDVGGVSTSTRAAVSADDDPKKSSRSEMRAGDEASVRALLAASHPSLLASLSALDVMDDGSGGGRDWGCASDGIIATEEDTPGERSNWQNLKDLAP